MKAVVALLLSLMVVAHAEHAKRQLSLILAAAEPVLSKLVLDKLGLDKIIGKFIGDVTGFFSGKSGTLPLEGTKIVLNYNMHKCSVHFGKRIIIPKLAEERCKADVCENHITHTCHSCTKHHQADALKCALEAEVAAIQKLAAAAAKQQAG